MLHAGKVAVLIIVFVMTIVASCCYITRIDTFKQEIKPFVNKSMTFLSFLCKDNIVIAGDDLLPVALNSPDMLHNLWFGLNTYTIQQYIHVITYGKRTFTPEHNYIYPKLLDMEGTCACGAEGSCTSCPEDAWLQKAKNIYHDAENTVNIVLVPTQVTKTCGYIAKAKIILRKFLVHVTVHELAHNVYNIFHSQARCGLNMPVLPDGYIVICDQPIDVKSNTVATADRSCLMGYDGGKFFNVAIAHTILGIVEPIADLTIYTTKGLYSFVLPAMERVSQNFVRVTTPNGYFYTSYHQKNKENPKWYEGRFDLPSGLDNKVYVHYIERNTEYSILESVLDIGSSYVHGSFTIKCMGIDITNTDMNNATIEINIH
jgi:hypothetical protein